MQPGCSFRVAHHHMTFWKMYNPRFRVEIDFFTKPVICYAIFYYVRWATTVVIKLETAEIKPSCAVIKGCLTPYYHNPHAVLYSMEADKLLEEAAMNRHPCWDG